MNATSNSGLLELGLAFEEPFVITTLEFAARAVPENRKRKAKAKIRYRQKCIQDANDRFKRK